jgi:glyoxalase family protein
VETSIPFEKDSGYLSSFNLRLMKLTLKGFHHVTAMTARARKNLQFYTGVLGMRLVKKTVNQDDVSAYHLFYADGQGSPGTDLTFFDWEHSARNRAGNRSISRVGLRLQDPSSLQWWTAHLDQHGLKSFERTGQNEQTVLDFEDPEGQRLSLVADEDSTPGVPWSDSPIPNEHQIRGLGPVTITVPRLAPTEKVLLDLMSLVKVREEGTPEGEEIHIYQMAAKGSAGELRVSVQPRLEAERPGAGGVHHVAFRVPDESQYHDWARRLEEFGIPNSGEIDRFYFRSLYFREPNGILFELATDGPGFATDEPLDRLGTRLSLPPFLEPRRAQIEAGLKPLEIHHGEH